VCQEAKPVLTWLGALSRIEISLTVSPVKAPDGRVIGASKCARDISQRKEAERRQHLLLREMNHRIKNLFTLAGGLITLSARSAATPKDLAEAVRGRLAALACSGKARGARACP
jgi:hypothetical protein